MSAGIMTTIILSLVGLVKLPFKKFKIKHPNGYKATFTGLSIILTIGGCLINQAFVINSEKLFNTDFVVTLLSTFAGVFGLYHTYEGLGGKALLNKLVNAIKNLKLAAPQSKLSKYIDKCGIDVALNIINAKQSEVTEVVVENAVVEKQVINAEHVEVNNANVNSNTINN